MHNLRVAILRAIYSIHQRKTRALLNVTMREFNPEYEAVEGALIGEFLAIACRRQSHSRLRKPAVARRELLAHNHGKPAPVLDAGDAAARNGGGHGS